MHDTIFAVSSGRPPAAIAVLRISGAGAVAAGEQLAGSLPPPRRAGVRTLHAPDRAILDRALVLHFPAPATATGEDLVELHLHGGRAVVAAVEAALAALPGLRPALPGEFTRRALSNGRIDLLQAQGLADLLAAETEQQRKQAIDSAEGLVSRMVAGWMADCAGVAALIEAAIDFEDEEDVAAADDALLDRTTEALVAALDSVLARPSVERYGEGIRVVLVGPTNAGKSSLFNALLGRDAAIVSAIAGTTRDRVEASVMRRGRIYTLVDTAGLRDETHDPIERIGIDRAIAARAGADVILDLVGLPSSDARSLAVYARADVRPPSSTSDMLETSTTDLASIDRLWSAIEQRGDAVLQSADGPTFHEAQRHLLGSARAALSASIGSSDLLLRAEEVRTASRSLGTLLGVDATEAMLDALFARFCVGK
ncbi:tRNA uridine-5-carboxymethylaminomethyl(34) synthesis GTPase MnmE [Sphingomonas radiodurans]|uniref:tRNA uridine-5-carboxymethylaminomethyl(34) synthesis GTPase MnmE n=1 Tax=Sphingomonas radiodurans TaxID=2890321 RepID=UPI001E46D6BA|nr:tRNA uridine-5-carboxymethylaminomethyl(34) synthesis GTPase MnmE [Sphingomonas radiodurans]WBH18104.1 tRNA uridine-5-carboxymethylaminomethyl(34) synthesis GTPase MnmE [Sphingomonas radiodurans]